MKNQRGASINTNINEYPLLEISTINNNYETGSVYNVLTVGIQNACPVITIINNNEPTIFRIPNELSGWAEMCIKLSTNGLNLFPANVEFGYLDNRYYAEIK